MKPSQHFGFGREWVDRDATARVTYYHFTEDGQSEPLCCDCAGTGGDDEICGRCGGSGGYGVAQFEPPLGTVYTHTIRAVHPALTFSRAAKAAAADWDRVTADLTAVLQRGAEAIAAAVVEIQEQERKRKHRQAAFDPIAEQARRRQRRANFKH